MPRLTRARTAHAATLLLITASIFAAARLVRADEFTGAPGNDPKDLTLSGPTGPVLPPPQPSADAILFAPPPTWARGVLMPPLPECLTPMGHHPVIATTPAPKPPPLAPPKDNATSETTTAGSAPAAKPETPAMITVSPFLQWVQSNPQAAAAQARQQAAAYQNPGAAPQIAAPANPNAPHPQAGSEPYWLPPLIDSPEVNSAPSSAPQPVTGSSAIYSTPQR